MKRLRLFAWAQSDLRWWFEARYQEYLCAKREQDKKRKLQIISMYVHHDYPKKYYAGCRELNRNVKRRGKNDHMRPSLLVRQSKFSKQFMEVYNRLEKELCLNNMSPSSPQRDPKAAELCVTSVVDSPPQASKKRSMNSQDLTASNEPVEVEQVQVSTSLLSKRRIKFTKEEDDAIRDGVKKFREGDWKSIKTYHAKVLNRRDNVAIKDRWRNIQLALNRRK